MGKKTATVHQNLQDFAAAVRSSTGVPPVNHGRDGHATLNIRQGARLPHWTKEGATYAVTFRLGDSLPKKVLNVWLFERENIVKTAKQMGRPLSPDEEKRLALLYSEKVGKYLDAGHGKCWMKEDRIARIVADALKHFDGDRYDLAAWCVMPNHVHVVVKPRAGHELSAILRSWKSFTAHEANKALKRKGRFWEEEYYDHLIRDEADYTHCMEYVLVNPEKAGLKNWKWVSSTGGTPGGVQRRAGASGLHGAPPRRTRQAPPAKGFASGLQGSPPLTFGDRLCTAALPAANGGEGRAGAGEGQGPECRQEAGGTPRPPGVPCPKKGRARVGHLHAEARGLMLANVVGESASAMDAGALFFMKRAAGTAARN